MKKGAQALVLLLTSAFSMNAFCFQPLEACSFMKSMMPNPPDSPNYNAWAPEYEGSKAYLCVALERDMGVNPGRSGIVNKLQYSAEGSQGAATHLTLALEVYNPGEINPRTLGLFNAAAGTLYKSAFGKLIPADITNSIMAEHALSAREGKYKISLTRSPFKNASGGYVLNFEIKQ